MSVAIIIALGLIGSLIHLVYSMGQKALMVFGPEERVANIETFNFARYDTLMSGIYPDNPKVLSTYGDLTATSSTSTAATTTKP